jgi:ADP-heptose:LPS heptosyltransferase
VFIFSSKIYLLTRILIIRFSSIGDIVLTTPVIRCLKKQWKGKLEIHFLTKRNFAGVLQANPHIDHTHVIENKVDEVTSELKALNFDYVIDLHNNIRTKQVKSRLGTKSFTFKKLNVKKWLLVNLKLNSMPPVHIVDRYLETVSALGIVNDGKGLDHFIPDSESIELTSLPESHRHGYIAWAIGGAHATKMLPIEKVIGIAKAVQKPVVLLGGPGDVANGKAIAEASGAHVFNGCGKFSIHQSALLIKGAHKVLTNDTGMMHIAAAFKKDILSFWGNTVPEFGMHPYLPQGEGSSKMMQVDNLNCRPCSKIGYKECPKKHFKCMLNQDETSAIEWVTA